MTDQNSTCAGTQELPISQDIIDILGCGTDYYRVLNINKKSFTADELKKSYRKVTKKKFFYSGSFIDMKTKVSTEISP